MRPHWGVLVPALLSGALALAEPVPNAKRIYIAPDDHTDYLWSGDEEAYRQAFVEMIDYYLDLADATEDHRPEHQSRWSCDGSLWMWTYERNKTPEGFERLLSRIRDGHMSVPLNALVSTYGAQPTEAVLRGMYYPGRIERRHGVRFPIAIAMEDQTLPYGLGALWAGSGARYSWKGICGCATRIRKNERRPQAVELVDSDPEFRSLYPYPVIGVFGKGWDDLKTLTDEFVTVARAKTDASRKVIVSDQLDFFRDFESSHGADLPTMSVGFGNEWDLYSASMSEVSARVRRAVERLRAAEGLATLVARERPGFWSSREQAREQAWMNLGVYWEHNWTSDSPVISREARAVWQRRLAGQIAGYVDTLHDDAVYALEHQNPLVAGRVRGGDAYPGETFSLLSIDNPDVLLWSVKPAEEGIEQGIVTRVWNLAPHEQRFSLSLTPAMESATQTTHIETDRAAVPVSQWVLSATAARSQLLTYRLRPAH